MLNSLKQNQVTLNIDFCNLATIINHQRPSTSSWNDTPLLSCRGLYVQQNSHTSRSITSQKSECTVMSGDTFHPDPDFFLAIFTPVLVLMICSAERLASPNSTCHSGGSHVHWAWSTKISTKSGMLLGYLTFESEQYGQTW